MLIIAIAYVVSLSKKDSQTEQNRRKRINKKRYSLHNLERQGVIDFSIICLLIVFQAVLLITDFSVLLEARFTTHKYSNSDFKIELSADKTDVKIGDEVVVKATFRNLSGHNVIIDFGIGDIDCTVEDIFSIGVGYGKEPRFIKILPYIIRVPLDFNKIIINKNFTLEETMTFIVRKDSYSDNYSDTIMASSFICIGKEKPENRLNINSEIIKLNIISD